MEKWRDIKGYEGSYQVSDKGNVRSVERRVTQKNGHGTTSIHVYKGQLLKQKDLRGYKRVGLSKAGKVSWKQVHRLVAETFIPNPEKKLQVDHINCIRDDNRVENLRWATAIENNRNPKTHSKHIGRLINRKDQSRRVAQYTTDGKLIRIFDSISETGRCGFNYACVGKCVIGKRKTHKGFIWKYG